MASGSLWRWEGLARQVALVREAQGLGAVMGLLGQGLVGAWAPAARAPAAATALPWTPLEVEGMRPRTMRNPPWRPGATREAGGRREVGLACCPGGASAFLGASSQVEMAASQASSVVGSLGAEVRPQAGGPSSEARFPRRPL